MDRNDQTGYGDEQGTTDGKSARERTAAPHSDLPPRRPERKLGAGSESTAGTNKTGVEHDRQGGKPNKSSDQS